MKCLNIPSYIYLITEGWCLLWNIGVSSIFVGRIQFRWYAAFMSFLYKETLHFIELLILWLGTTMGTMQQRKLIKAQFIYHFLQLFYTVHLCFLLNRTNSKPDWHNSDWDIFFWGNSWKEFLKRDQRRC